MQQKRVVPSLVKIALTDYFGVLLCILPVAAIVGCGALVSFGEIDAALVIARLAHGQLAGLGRDGAVLGIALAVLLLAPPFLAIRVSRIRRVFREGVEAPGEVLSFWKFRDRGTIRFEFECEGEVIRAVNLVHLSRAVKTICVGQRITVVHLPKTGKPAFIKEAFS